MTVRPPRRTFFLPTRDGQRLCVYYAPQAACVARVLHVAPLAEEMNKARRMTALQAQALAAAGCAVLLIDLLGCGDSTGDFADASWTAWLDDLDAAHAWLSAQVDAPDWVWGVRAGALLGNAWARRRDHAVHHLLWQPSLQGKTVLQQLLRLKVAGDMLEGSSGTGIEDLKTQLAQGQPVEVAGYTLSPELAAGLGATELTPPAHAGRVVWFELSTREEASLTPAASKALDRWRAAGHSVQAGVVQGPSFWQTTEIEDAPALVAAGVSAFKLEAAA